MEAWDPECILSDALDIKGIPGTIISYNTCHIVSTGKKKKKNDGETWGWGESPEFITDLQLDLVMKE